MESNRFFNNLILIVLVLSGALTTASAYTVDPLPEPYSPGNVGNLSDSVRIVNLTDNGEPVNESDLGNSFYFNYTYNKTGAEPAPMQHLEKGYWYAWIKPNTSEGDKILYKLKEKTGTQDEFTATETVEFGNYSLEILSSIESELSPGETIDVRVNVTDEWNSEPETGANVDIYFTNGTDLLDIQDLGNQDGSEYYNSQVKVPSNYGGNYILHINASNPSESFEDPNGSISMPVTMEPPIQGDIERLESTSGCNNSSFFRECEVGAGITTGYNVTGDNPTSVNLTIRKWNSSSNSWEKSSETAMLKDDIYEANVTVPDINTSSYGKKIQLVFNASSGQNNAVKKYNITLRTYSISFGAASSADQGGDYSLEIAFERYFSAKPLDSSRIDAEVNITNSSGDLLRQYSLSDFDYSEGLFQRNVQIGSNWSEGTYTVKVKAENTYGDSKTAEDSFFVEEVNRTFEITDDIEGEINSTGEKQFEFSVQNRIDSEITLTAEPMGEISDFTTVNNGEEITVEAGEEKDVEASFNLTVVESYKGNISLEDSGGFNETVDVDLNLPECDVEEDSICLIGDNETTRFEEGPVIENLDLYYTGNDERQVEPSVSGNISGILELEPMSFEFNSSKKYQRLQLNFTNDSSQYYEGELQAGDLDTGLSFRISEAFSRDQNNSEQTGELSFSVPSSIDLGTVAENDIVTRDIRIANTGSKTIDSVEFSSEEMEISADSSSIAPGQTESFQLEVSNPGTGAVTVTANSGSQEESREIEVQAEVVPDLVEKSQQLSSTIRSLQTRVESTERQQKLNTASLNVTEIQNAYEAGEYEKAQRIYRATEQQLNTIERNAASPDSGNRTEIQSQQQESSNMLLYIGGGVLFFLLIGFVFIESYIPEEGDPLYSVLGQ